MKIHHKLFENHRGQSWWWRFSGILLDQKWCLTSEKCWRFQTNFQGLCLEQPPDDTQQKSRPGTCFFFEGEKKVLGESG